MRVLALRCRSLCFGVAPSRYSGRNCKEPCSFAISLDLFLLYLSGVSRVAQPGAHYIQALLTPGKSVEVLPLVRNLHLPLSGRIIPPDAVPERSTIRGLQSINSGLGRIRPGIIGSRIPAPSRYKGAPRVPGVNA